MFAASLTYSPHPIRGGTVNTIEYNHIAAMVSVAPFRRKYCCAFNGLDTIKYLSNDNTVRDVIDVMPMEEIKIN